LGGDLESPRSFYFTAGDSTASPRASPSAVLDVEDYASGRLRSEARGSTALSPASSDRCAVRTRTKRIESPGVRREHSLPTQIGRSVRNRAARAGDRAATAPVHGGSPTHAKLHCGGSEPL